MGVKEVMVKLMWETDIDRKRRRERPKCTQMTILDGYCWTKTSTGHKQNVWQTNIWKNFTTSIHTVKKLHVRK